MLFITLFISNMEGRRDCGEVEGLLGMIKK